MGQGDKPIAYRPFHTRIRDDVIGKEFAACAVRSCPEPHVIKRFGVGGVANVSVWTCRRCKYHTEHPLHFGVGCAYGLEQDVSPGASS